jgi:hypothetical protein
MFHNHIEDQLTFCNKTIWHKARLTMIDDGRDHLSHSRSDDAGVNFGITIDQIGCQFFKLVKLPFLLVILPSILAKK